MRAQTAHTIGSERQACGSLTPLAIEDASNDGIGVMRCQAAQQIDGVLGGADRRRVGARQGNIKLAQEPAAPAQHQVGVGFLALNTQGDLFEQRTQQFFAVPIARRGRRPDAFEILAEREDRITFFAPEGTSSRVFSIRELCFGGLQFAQSAFPLRFESARNESIVRVDCAIAPFGALRAVARSLELAPELREGGFVIGLELLDGLQRGGKPRRCERRQKRCGHSRIDLDTTDVQAILASAIDDVLAGAVIPGRGVSAAVMHGQATPAMSAHGDALQQRCAFSHGAPSMMRAWTEVVRKAALVGFEGLPVDEAAMMVADEHGPLGAWAQLDALA